ncbi:MAG: hypothetical protein JNM14_06815, partial [Ferruginibacter sp.]|nr:hypothetical protein [Ferruginibacter sp.]
SSSTPANNSNTGITKAQDAIQSMRSLAGSMSDFKGLVPAQTFKDDASVALGNYRDATSDLRKYIADTLEDERIASNDQNFIAATKAVESYGWQIIDDESKSVLIAMLSSKPGTMMRHVADYCVTLLNSQTLVGIVRSDHGNILKPYIPADEHAILNKYIDQSVSPGYAWYQSVKGGKGYIMFRKNGFNGQTPALVKYDTVNEWRTVLAHEIQHARNVEESLFPESWTPTSDFYIEVNKAKDLATSNGVSVWNCIRHIVGELAGRFVNWYIWEEIGPPESTTVLLPTPEAFFRRCFNEVKTQLNGVPYDTSGYINYLVGISEDKLAEQVAVWLEHVAYRCYLFDAVCNPPLRGKDLFLAAAAAYKADRVSWKTTTIIANGSGIH